MEFSQKIMDKLFQIKKDSIEIPVYKEDKKIGFLKPITISCVNDSIIIKLLAKWREINFDSYPTQFKVTEEGTKIWLDEQVIKKSDRVLFFVYDRTGKIIGHMGLASFDYRHKFCEIDNVVRGSDEEKGLMTLSLKALIKWALENLGIEYLSLRVFSDNTRAIKLYARVGFHEIKRIPLERLEENGVIKFVEMPHGSEKDPDRYFSVMNFRKDVVKKQILTSGPSISELEVEYVRDAVKNGWNQSWNLYIKKFEKKFAEYSGVRYAISTSSCTGALHLSLLAMGIKHGDEVIIPDLSWVAAISAALYCGAKPVFADVDSDTWCLDPGTIEKHITEKTKAIIPVHSYGYPCDMNRINKIAKNNNLFVLEDAAPAVGSIYMGKRPGGIGDMGVFSFQGAKIMVTGEGGMIVTDNEEFYKKAQFYGDHGRDTVIPFFIKELGYKYKMSNIQAALGLAQFERIEEFVSRKREIFNQYKYLLDDIEGIRFLKEFDGVRTNHWMISIILDGFTGKKQEFMSKLKEKAIDTRSFFFPNSSFPFLERYNNPVSYFLSENGVNIPSGVNLTEDEVNYVAENIRKILEKWKQ